MGQKFQLHATGLESLARCGIAFERRYILGERVPPSARMLIGTAVDRAVRADMEHKKETGKLRPLDEIQDAARDTLVQEWANGVRLVDDDQEDGIETRDKALDTSVALAALHHSEAAPSIQPLHVARKWVLDVDGLPIQVAGEIDIQEPDCIRDTKTSGKSPVKTAADTSLQLTTYALAVRQIDGAIPPKVALDFCVRTPKRGETKLVVLNSTRTEQQLNPLMERIALMSRIIESGIFTPCEVGHWYCSPKYCGYYPTCKYAAHPVSVAVNGSK
ncbi:MAG TPA: PD-(D/E)XK nuclease family protein [Bryobacteraceae bacterium]|nr:PD-(D/E)XK nuclease family protein [Bryobacteraceae bacterium]